MYTVDSNFVHTFAGNPLDRAQHLRKDPAELAALQQSSESRFLPFHKLKVATNRTASLAWVKNITFRLTQINLYSLAYTMDWVTLP